MVAHRGDIIAKSGIDDIRVQHLPPPGHPGSIYGLTRYGEGWESLNLCLEEGIDTNATALDSPGGGR